MNIRKNFNTMTWVLIPVAIAINVVVGQLVLLLKLHLIMQTHSQQVQMLGQEIKTSQFTAGSMI